MDKKSAYQFFKDLQRYLNQEIRSPKMFREEIGIVVREARASEKGHHKAFPEGAFLNHYVAQNLYDFISQ